MNKTINKFYLVLTGISFLALSSCTKDIEPDYPDARVKPVVSFQSVSYEVAEGKEIEVTLVTNQVLNEDMEFQLDIVKPNSVAQDIEDFEIGLDGVNAFDYGVGSSESYKVTFPKFTSTYKFKVTAILDDLVEQDETAYLRITSKGNLNGNVNSAASVAAVKILQRGANIIDLTFDWQKTFAFSGSNFTLCQIGYDVDFILADSSGAQLDYIAGTAACPEVGEIDIDALGVGSYQILVNIYDNGGLSGAGVSPSFMIPVTMTYARSGSVLNGTFVQSAANVVDSNFASDPTGAHLKYLVSFSIAANGIVTFTDATTGTTVASGKNVKPVYTGFDKLPKRVK